ncbi:hypothetical protein CRE_22954 [Caenorhabditis remanei]|uniref:Uncharacterized protein n=1 Tax=Caenorhabditis remanei TaxID=31234 RepID=E3MW04_CAERE|nr:hypothetical protein CRE_22954 [Caenorhabditis remanei]
MPPGSMEFTKFGSYAQLPSTSPKKTMKELKTTPKRRKSEIPAPRTKKSSEIMKIERETDDEEAEEDQMDIQDSPDLPGPSTPASTAVPANKPSKKNRKKKTELLAEVYTHRHYRLVLSGYDQDADSDTELADASQGAVITDNWRPEYSYGTQELADPDNIPRIVVEDEDFFLKPKEEFQIPEKMIACDRNAEYFDLRTHELVPTRDPLHYEVTAHDIAWLEMLNKKRKLLDGAVYLSLPDFIRIIQSLERDTFVGMHNKLLDCLHVVYTRPPEDVSGVQAEDDTECDVCRISECDVNDEMVFCDMCNTCVHMLCAGIQQLPEDGIPWKCAKCEYTNTPAPPCQLCPCLGGSMTYNETKTEWAHHSCALFIPEIMFDSEDCRAPMYGFENVPEERFNQICCVCDTRQGACVTCSDPDCEETFHVCCALRAGCTIKIQEVPNDPQQNVTRVTLCHRHSAPRADLNIAEEFFKERKPWLAKWESIFYLMTNYEKTAESVNMDEIIVSDVYEYWKQKRLDAGGPLIPHLHDQIRIEPKIDRVAKKAEENLQFLLNKAGISSGRSPSSDETQFFRPAALMVTESRQIHLKRAADCIERDLVMLRLVENREVVKNNLILTELEQFRLARRILDEKRDSEDVGEILKATLGIQNPKNPKNQNPKELKRGLKEFLKKIKNSEKSTTDSDSDDVMEPPTKKIQKTPQNVKVQNPTVLLKTSPHQNPRILKSLPHHVDRQLNVSTRIQAPPPSQFSPGNQNQNPPPLHHHSHQKQHPRRNPLRGWTTTTTTTT